MAEAERTATEFVLERVFAAPPKMVWRTWTDPELLVRWYKPNQTCQTAVLEHDLRPGGVMRYEMRFGEMPPHLERWEFSVIDPPRRLQWKHMLTDADGTVVGNPRMPDWPRMMLTTIELSAHPEGTLQRLVWAPLDATEDELACFLRASSQSGQGWASGFDNLGEFLRTLAAESS